MFNFDYVSKENLNEHNPEWPEIPDQSYWILLIGAPGSGKANIT